MQKIKKSINLLKTLDKLRKKIYTIYEVKERKRINIYTSYIVDELGTIRYVCSESSQKEIDEILENHEEWSIRVY